MTKVLQDGTNPVTRALDVNQATSGSCAVRGQGQKPAAAPGLLPAAVASGTSSALMVDNKGRLFRFRS